jgi:hypothetical protein
MASTDKFKTTVIQVRDILRGSGITGMDSMRHICLYLLSRYMTRAKVSALGVPEEFAWETLIDLAQTKNGGVQNALDCFYHSDADCLVRHFDRLFATDKFSFDLKNPQKHKEILELLNIVNIAEVDFHMDILGWVYEQHLHTGSSAARDLGQFFTKRSICEYMTILCRPGFKSEGVPESVCDPSMGTGGFLTSFIKYYKKAYPDKPVNWSVQQKEIHGCDTDPKVAGLARLNIFMETDGGCPSNLLTHDSLYGDLRQTFYDIILANMPFGLKGIKHADCCERVKDLKIRGTKSEPLFLQLMMASLNAGGRCAVVVPEGMLVNDAQLYRDTRMHLMEHFELRRVIKMKGRFFMNTAIQPSILFFEKTGKPTQKVEFWEVVNDDKVTSEKLIVSVPRSKIDLCASFDVRRYVEPPAASTLKVPICALSDLVGYQNGKTLASSEKVESGKYNVMGGGMTYVGKTNQYNRDGETISISKSGASAGFVMYHTTKYWAGDCLTIKPNNESTSIKFLYYYLKLNNNIIMSLTSGSTIPHCKWDDIKTLQIPLPPRKVQDEIVATLDEIYADLIASLVDRINKVVESECSNINASELMSEARQFLRKYAQIVADIKARNVLASYLSHSV